MYSMLVCRAESRIAKTQIKAILQNSKTARIKVQKHVQKVDYSSHQTFMYNSGEKERIPYINSHYVS